MLRAESLCKVYPHPRRPVEVLQDLSLEVPTGEHMTLMGPSGEGKSTLLQLLGCLDRPTSGRYWLEGREVSALDEEALAGIRNARIGFVFQSSFFVDYLDLTDNVALPGIYARTSGAAVCRERAQELLAQLGLAHRSTHRPAELSGGERQRAAIARALFNRPGLLLADEPTGNLDADNTRQIMARIAALRDEGITVVLVTHDKEVAAYADRVLQLSAGRLTEASLAAA
ncbi:MAG: ABC transporter ATP-binding protein [Pseudomonadota bacterium]